MIIKGHANIYKEESGRYGFDYSIFVYAMEMAADDAAKKSGDARLMGRAIKVEFEVPDESGI